ncbi:MAG: MBL fold metallo-hydrolase [Lachnospiraceae bacterium]|jgi:L-ascorbate metabolism protein UlaG (beta-lactamase superfamily)|nr:MBL fold metallo-hydrolase [Lachnospiraceae bacterium]
MKLTWLGHSCFKVEKGDFIVILDPYADGSVPGLASIRERANLVLCSHEHNDHNYRDGIGLWEAEENPFTVEQMNTYHDDAKGERRGENQITILGDGETRLAHMGDLGCEPEPEQLEQLKGVDVLLLPVGGHYTIDAAQAADLVKKIEPRIVVPMHYRDDEEGFGFDVLGKVEEFLEKMDSIKKEAGSELETDEAQEAQVIVLRPRNLLD